MVRKSVNTNIKQTASRQTLYFTTSTLHHILLQYLLFGDFTIAIFLFFYNIVLRVRWAASIDPWQACEYRFTE
jgi:hypothetical protein